jgi:hypothetical protein
MKEKPIIFSAPMVKAILDGRKTQTRRIIKSQPLGKYEGLVLPHSTQYKEGKHTFRFIEYEKAEKDFDKALQYISSPYTKDDVLWVRETFAELDLFEFGYKKEPPELYGYKADMSAKFVYSDDYLDTFAWNWEHDTIKWKPSIFMPKDAARIFIKVKEVRVERVQDISEADAVAEGMQTVLDKSPTSAILRFDKLWVEINGIKSWKENLFVWVITFERIER